jgi:hypothetical protein
MPEQLDSGDKRRNDNSVNRWSHVPEQSLDKLAAAL